MAGEFLSGISVAQPDITLFLDINGIIRDVTLSGAINADGVDTWRGRAWVDTVGDVGSGKVRRMVEDARTNGVSAYRQVNQRFPNGLELPMEYTTVRLGAQEGLIAVGKSLQAVAELQSRLIAAQQAMEHDYWKLREVETRYRQLFDASNEPVVLVRVDNLTIIEANPAAIRTIGVGRGHEFLPELPETERDSFKSMLARVRDQGRGPGILARLGASRQQCMIRASLMTTEGGPAYMLQIVPTGAGQLPTSRQDAVALDDLFEHIPDGFVVIDAEGIIRLANPGFLALVQIGAESGVEGERLGRWLSRPGADIAVLFAHLQRHGVVRRFATTLHSELGTDVQVELSAAASTGQRSEHIGVVIRDMGRRLPPADTVPGLHAALGVIIEQSGKTSLPKLVRDTVGVVERHCIEAALDMVDGNRTAAAELLGLSRQSLYEKLNRYEMDGHSKSALERSDGD